MSEQLPLWFDDVPDDLPDIEDPPEARCGLCGVLLDEASISIGFCSSECEKESANDKD